VPPVVCLVLSRPDLQPSPYHLAHATVSCTYVRTFTTAFRMTFQI